MCAEWMLWGEFCRRHAFQKLSVNRPIALKGMDVMTQKRIITMVVAAGMLLAGSTALQAQEYIVGYTPGPLVIQPTTVVVARPVYAVPAYYYPAPVYVQQPVLYPAPVVVRPVPRVTTVRYGLFHRPRVVRRYW